MPHDWSIGRLGRRLLGACLLVAVVPFAVAMLVGSWQGRALVERFVADNAAKTARAFAADLDAFLARQHQLLERLRNAPERNDALLAGVLAGDPNLVALFGLDGDGRVVHASRPADALEAWAVAACRSALDRPDGTVTHAGVEQGHFVVVGIPDGDGALCAQITFTLHQGLLAERAQSLAGGTAYIVDRAGRVVCHGFAEGEDGAVTGDLLDAAVATAAGSGRPFQGVVGQGASARYAAYAPAADLPWGVWVEVPAEVVAAAVRPFLLGTGAVTVAAGLGLVALVAGLVRRTVRPVRELAAAADRVALGDYGTRLDTDRDDEIGDLARAFHRMTEAVRQSHARLDERVAERTAQLAAARAFSDRLLDTMAERILVIDRDLRVVRANAAARRAYGDDVVGSSCTDLHGTFVGGGVGCPASRVFATGEPLTEERAREHDGRAEVLVFDWWPLKDETGEVRSVLECARDVTEQRELQARVAHQEKMAAVGTLAAGLAHEIGNPLASMSSELEMLEQRFDPDEARAALLVLRDQIRRIARLLRELVDLGRQPRDEVGPVDAEDLLEHVARLLRHDPRSHGVEVRVDAPPDGVELVTNRDRALQVLLNLGLNALDAAGNGGHVTLRAWREPDGEVGFAVEDDGPGLAPEVRARVFQPFFTTKQPGHGTGLGLFVTERTVHRLGGRIRVDSAPGTGARFEVRLPPGGPDVRP